MKTIKKQVEEIINEPLHIDNNIIHVAIQVNRLEEIVLKLAQQIDILHEFKQDAP